MKAIGDHKELVEHSTCAYCGDAARKGHAFGLVQVEIRRTDPRMEMLDSKFRELSTFYSFCFDSPRKSSRNPLEVRWLNSTDQPWGKCFLLRL